MYIRELRIANFEKRNFFSQFIVVGCFFVFVSGMISLNEYLESKTEQQQQKTNPIHTNNKYIGKRWPNRLTVGVFTTFISALYELSFETLFISHSFYLNWKHARGSFAHYKPCKRNRRSERNNHTFQFSYTLYYTYIKKKRDNGIKNCPSKLECSMERWM